MSDSKMVAELKGLSDYFYFSLLETRIANIFSRIKSRKIFPLLKNKHLVNSII